MELHNFKQLYTKYPELEKYNDLLMGIYTNGYFDGHEKGKYDGYYEGKEEGYWIGFRESANIKNEWGGEI